MKKLFAVIIAIFIIAALCACEANPDPQSPTSTYRTGDTITIYVAKQDYDFGDPVVKSMFDAVEVKIEDGYLTENGTIFTPEQLRTEPIITDKNWSTYVSGSTCVYPEMQKGEILLPINCIDRHECTFDDVLHLYNMVREYYEQRIILGNNEELTEDKYGNDRIEKYSLTLKYNEKYTPLIRSCNDLHGYIRSFGSNWGKTESEIYAILVNGSNAIIDLGDECGYDVSAVKNWKYDKENWWNSATTGHTIVTTNAVAPTCTIPGKTESSYCTTCGEVIIESQIIPATGHSFGSWYIETSATCIYDGYQRRECADCNFYETATILAYGHSYEQQICTACGKHQYLTFSLNDDNQSYSVNYVADKSVTEIIVPDVFCGLPVTTISSQALRNCDNLISIVIPDSVTQIQDAAFAYCERLANITLPDTIISIGDNCFTGTALYADARNWDDGVLYIGNYLIKADYNYISGKYTIKDGTKCVASKAFYNCNSLTRLEMPDCLIGISYEAFGRCQYLTEIVFGAGLISIGNGAFCNCDRLQSISLPGSVAVIGDRAFSSCGELETITSQNGISKIGKAAFSGCVKLKEITISNSVTEFGQLFFYNCSSLADIYYDGTYDQWLAIHKEISWDYYVEGYTVHCTDGDYIEHN